MLLSWVRSVKRRDERHSGRLLMGLQIGLWLCSIQGLMVFLFGARGS